MSSLSTVIGGTAYIYVHVSGSFYTYNFANPLNIAPHDGVAVQHYGPGVFGQFGSATTLRNYGGTITAGHSYPNLYVAGVGVLLGGSGSLLVNQGGSITGGAGTQGADGGAGVYLSAGTLANNVVPNYTGGYAFNGGATNYLYTGRITGGSSDSGTGGNGVSLMSAGSLTNAGIITGGASDSGGGGIGVSLQGQSYFANSGTIYGGASTTGSGGVGAEIVNDYYPFFNANGMNNIDNFGVIHGGNGASGGVGLELSNSFAYNGIGGENNSGISIVGGSATAGHSGGTGVVLESGSRLMNAASIRGGDSALTGGSGGTGAMVDASSYLTNSGVIAAGTSAAGQSLGVGVIIDGGTVEQGGTGSIRGTDVYDATHKTHTFGDAVQFGTGNGTLKLYGESSLSGDIGGFQVSDSIVVSGSITQATGVAHYANTYDVGTPSGTLEFNGSFAGEHFVLTNLGGGTTEVTLAEGAACYARGTRIDSVTGEVAIECLEVGALLRTAAGELRPVRWIGRRAIDCTQYSEPAVVWPICIQAGAIAARLPARDLWLSPGHSILLDGALIQADKLVNGVTIRQVPCERIEYWHVELDSHDVILAEGLAAESYLDTGNRTAFVNGGDFLELHPTFQPKHWSETCFPLVTAGPELTTAKATVLARASELGYLLTDQCDVHAVVDGKRLDPVMLASNRIAFALPADAERIELRCRCFVPAHTDPESHDGRSLGLCVDRVQVDGNEVPLDDETRLCTGWHSLESSVTGHSWRWSQPRVPLPAGTRLVVLDIASRGYYWETAAQARLVASAL